MSTEEKQSSKNEGPQFTLPDPATAYEKASAAFKGAEWLNDSQYKQSDEVLAAALAINETVEKQRIAAEKASFDEQKRGMISQLDADIAYAPDEETRNKLRDIRDQVRDAKFGDSIAAIVANAKTATTAATSKADGPSPEVLQLVQKIKEVDKKIEKNLDTLYANGAIGKDEYETLKQEEKDLAKLNPGSPEWLEANKKHQENLEKLYKRLDETTPATSPHRETVTEGKAHVEERRELSEQVARQTVLDSERQLINERKSFAEMATSKQTAAPDLQPMQVNSGLQAVTLSNAESGTLASPQGPTKAGEIKLGHDF